MVHIWHRSAHLALLLVTAQSAFCAPGPDAPPLDPTEALAELAAREKSHSRAVERLRQNALETLKQGCAGTTEAARLYEEAIRGAGEEDMPAWRKRNSDLLRDRVFQKALLLRWRYLYTSLRRAASDDADSWAGPSLEYARALATLQASRDYLTAGKAAREVLGQPISDGPVVRWLRLASLLPPGDQWEQSPGKLPGILEKNVRTPWRKTSDPRLDDTWLLELETSAVLAGAGGSDRAAEDFTNHTAPSLRFRRARDRATVGQPNRATTDLLELTRQHPDHPDFPLWAATLRQMLENQSKTPSSSAQSR
jgi:predicted Zn-dependent protease